MTTLNARPLLALSLVIPRFGAWTGFISRDSGDDVFVHFRAIRGEGHRVLTEGQRVEFTIMMRDKGLQAEDVVTL